ncbi:MAG: hypothetical protein MUC60_07845 [Oscillatoria sp. Prado101]|nr:hypothetical protein [Oscillatoria sp. Prado101]
MRKQPVWASPTAPSYSPSPLFGEGVGGWGSISPGICNADAPEPLTLTQMCGIARQAAEPAAGESGVRKSDSGCQRWE